MEEGVGGVVVAKATCGRDQLWSRMKQPGEIWRRQVGLWP